MLRVPALSALLLLAGLPHVILAQDEGFTWENATELSYAATAGNSSSDAFALKAELTGSGGPNEFKLQLGGIRASSDITTRTAAGTTANYQITETSSSELSAAAYNVQGRYDREFSTAFLFAGAGWERNTFSGFNHRWSFVSGFGRTWVDGDSGHFKTDAGATYTIQKDVEPAPGADDAFWGGRLSIDAARSLTATTDFTSKLVADQNFEDSEDFRADWINSIAVSISEGLALKTSYQILYDHAPALIRVPIVSGAGTGDTVLTEGDKFDTVLTLALVIKL